MQNNILLILLISLLSSVSYSQNQNPISKNIKIGDVYTIGYVTNNDYIHINFPKDNFIIKKGGIADYKKVIGKEVEVTSIKEEKDGNVIATIKLTSQKSFFNSHKYITVNIIEAVNQKELLPD